MTTAEVEMKAQRMITPLKFEINLNDTSEFRSYLTEHTLVLHYKNELINDVQRNARRMF
jgi:hypothetical protein